MARSGATHHADDVFAVLNDESEHSTIAASWRRRLTRHKLDPERPEPPVVLCGFELREARGLAGRMLRAADPELDRLHDLVASLGYAGFITDAKGIMVARRVADMDESACRRWRLWPGAVWSEALEGTNGVGTCLAERRAITVHRDQHFRTRHTCLTCTVSPLFDAAGRLAGALDISSFRPTVLRHSLGSAMNEACVHVVAVVCHRPAKSFITARSFC